MNVFKICLIFEMFLLKCINGAYFYLTVTNDSNKSRCGQKTFLLLLCASYTPSGFYQVNMSPVNYNKSSSFVPVDNVVIEKGKTHEQPDNQSNQPVK